MTVEPFGSATAVPRKLFEHRFSASVNLYGLRYAVTRDGRFITVVTSGNEPSPEIRLIFNWSEDLKARVPIPR